MQKLAQRLIRPIRIDDIIERLLSYRPDADIDLIRKAFVLSSYAHKNQLRHSGEPYLNHPLAVAYLVASWHLDEISVAAALIHDVIEDAPDLVSTEMLEKTVGKEVLHIVEALTKLERHRFESREERQAEYFIRMLLAATEDPRVLYVKLADRLHNMTTLDVMPRQKQIRIAEETQSIYVPLALRLGVGQAYAELADLCLKYLEPEAYRKIAAFVEANLDTAREVLSAITRELRDEFDSRGIPSAEIHHRIKRPFSIYKKMIRKGVRLEDIMDFIGIRIIVDTVGQCYETLGIIHQKWNYIRDEFDDYIALPKPNKYQSIHTAILYPWKDRLIPVEVQIRTHEMHEIAERGIAAHIIYKGAVPADDPRFISWVKSIQDLREETRSPDEFLQRLQEMMSFDKIYVFTPRGDIVELPRNATPIDFAFHIHTDIGLHCYRARVNGRLVDLGYRLKSGDTVEIITNPQQEPTEEWLRLVVSRRTRHKIRSFLRKKRMQELNRTMERGREILRSILKDFPDWDEKRLLQELKQQQAIGSTDVTRLATLQALYAAVGEGVITEKRLREFLKKWEEQKEASLIRKILKPFSRKTTPSSRLVISDDHAPLVVEFRRAACCTPLPGEPVILYMPRRATRLPTLHRSDCSRLKELDPARQFTNITWLPGAQEWFIVPLRVITEDRAKMLADILEVFSALHINLQHVKADAINGQGHITIVPQLRDAAMLQRVMNQIQKIKGVYEVQRIPADTIPTLERTPTSSK